MSDRLPLVDNLCTNPDNHSSHICELKAAGNQSEVTALQETPKFVCGNCGTVAKEAGALCAPGPLDA